MPYNIGDGGGYGVHQVDARSMPPQLIFTPRQPSSTRGGESNQRHPHELFVGNLSFFCEENHLLELFSPFGRVDSHRVVRNGGQRRSRSLLYGFVCMSTRKESLQAIDALNGMMFMGRALM